VIAGVVAAVLVGGGVVFALTRGGGGGPTTSGSGTNTTTGPVGPQLDWARVDLPQGIVLLHAVTVTTTSQDAREFVAAGSATAEGGADAAVIVSADGSSWRRVGQGSLKEPGEQRINGLISTETNQGRLLVAVGSDDSSGSRSAGAWFSEDGGLTWTQGAVPTNRFGGEDVMNRVTKTAGGLVAVGFTTGADTTTDGAIWISRDNAATWKLAHVLGGPGDQELTRLATLRDGGTTYVAAGSTTDGAAGLDAAVWTSPDAKVWTKVTDRDLGGAGDQKIYDLQVFGSQLIGVGSDSSAGNGKDGAAWLSPDGRQWTRSTAGLGGEGDQVLTRVVPSSEPGQGAPTVVATGFEVVSGNQDAAVWYSTDGQTWTRETVSQAALDGGGKQQTDSLHSEPGGFPFIAVGTDGDQGAMWRASGPANG
jgi:hypothetical protein